MKWSLLTASKSNSTSTVVSTRFVLVVDVVSRSAYHATYLSYPTLITKFQHCERSVHCVLLKKEKGRGGERERESACVRACLCCVCVCVCCVCVCVVGVAEGGK